MFDNYIIFYRSKYFIDEYRLTKNIIIYFISKILSYIQVLILVISS